MRILLIILVLSFPLYASLDGLNQTSLDKEKIAGFSRGCCNLAPHPFLNTLGLFQFVDKDNLGPHHYGQKPKKDSMGLVYTCAAGFVDIGHLRDNADWTAKLYAGLKTWVGSGQSVPVRNEGGYKSRSIYFPKLSPEKKSALSNKDYADLAVSVAFNLATIHEITTAFDIAVSFPVTMVMYERASSFSVEDQYSNLLGGIIGARALLSNSSYEEEVERGLKLTLENFGAKGRDESIKIHEELHGRWWNRDPLARFKTVLKRNYGYKGRILPVRAENINGCQDVAPSALYAPEKLTQGQDVNDYFELRGEVNRKLRKRLAELGAPVGTYLTQKEFPRIIDLIEMRFEAEINQIKSKN